MTVPKHVIAHRNAQVKLNDERRARILKEASKFYTTNNKQNGTSIEPKRNNMDDETHGN